MNISLADAEATVELGRALGRALNERRAEGGEQLHVVLFFGDLGTGKTTFTRGLIDVLPGGENAEVSSPSFTLCNSYRRRPSSIAICTDPKARCPMRWTRRWMRKTVWFSWSGPNASRTGICLRNVWTSGFKSAKITGW